MGADVGLQLLHILYELQESPACRERHEGRSECCSVEQL